MLRHLSSAALVACLLPSPAQAARDDLHRFATCAGRLSALMTHQWMFDGAGSEQTAIHRRAMIGLIDAIILPDEGPQVLHWRLSAKHAHATLLRRASFNRDPADAAWAAQMAAQFTSGCLGLLPHTWSS
ncbi:hypothetical protein ACJ5NV_04265 [Loktanella agnita]|uniref:hypothetical protein n=1 Tax=Loktanella agnita TaxID=287097 RepID=UPI003985AD79